MAEILRSVGLDIGTTSTQMILSKLTIENRASAFSVPEMQIASREILYRSPIHFTPLLHGDLVDGEGIRAIVLEEYEKAGITRAEVDTGAVIITGETSRKENAAAVLQSLSDFAGDFVVATAGPDLESVLAAKGAGAVDFSIETGKTVLHMDIGGGTSNLALIEDGHIVATGCLNVGGRLLKFDRTGTITYISPVLHGIFDHKLGETPSTTSLEALADALVSVLEMAAGLRDTTDLLDRLWTKDGEAQRFPRGEAVERSETEEERRNLNCRKKSETSQKSSLAARIPLPPQCAHWGTFPPGEGITISFSGGVADCIETAHPDFTFGDMGPMLGRAIRQSRLCQGPYRLGRETIRATVIGAGSHATQLSGSTVYHQNVTFPLKSLPVVREISGLATLDGPGVLAISGIPDAHYHEISALADQIANNWPPLPVLIALEADMAKALGHALALRLPKDRPILCIDRVLLPQNSYLDIAAPVDSALPVVVKTLILEG